MGFCSVRQGSYSLSGVGQSDVMCGVVWKNFLGTAGFGVVLYGKVWLSPIKKMKIEELFNKPKLIGLIGNVNEGKSNALYYLIEELRKNYKFNIWTFGLRNKIKGCSELFSVEELEQIKDSLIILDEVMSLFDLNDRNQKRQIEQTLRLINHNNNILVLCGVPDKFRRFISDKLDIVIYKKVSFGDFVRGSRVKRICLNYSGLEKGSNVLNLEKNEILIFNSSHYKKIKISYLPKYDTKKDNKPILKKIKKVSKK